ncbi:MAG: electron transfer flavoprotein subunit alpha/FixB family protein, partial [Desulfobacteraceae bacterium]|nr:electron transfer flavoprotein subunit alpha/FixB family protein [Desulfobacteraceae bacterium]
LRGGSLMAGILVFSETRDGTRELLSAGRDLAGKLGTTLTAFATEEGFAQDYIACGADEVLVLPALAADQPIEAYVPVLLESAKARDPDVFLIGATARGKEIAAKLAVGLNAGLCSGCSGFALDGAKLKMERMLYGGAAVQTVVCTTRPQMASVLPRSFDPAQPEEGRQGKITKLSTSPRSAVRVVSRAPKQRESVDITEAKVVVCVGRGVEKVEDISLARDLAQAAGGEVGCSRPIAEEMRWLPEDVYLGISGKKVKPDLYIGVGVSGQIQHVTGIRDSKVIFAINKDENAPIFEAADYGIVGDLYQVVPKLIEEIKAALKG